MRTLVTIPHTSASMRLVFGHAKLLAIPGGFGLEALGLAVPARLKGLANGSALPDLTASAGQIVDFSGLLDAPVGNMAEPTLLVSDLAVPQHALATTTPLLVTVSGRIGKTPEPNRKENPDWFSASICYQNGPNRDVNGSWIRLTARSFASVADAFQTLESGTKITASGFLESWLTENKQARCGISLRGMERSNVVSYAAATAPAQTLITAAAPTTAEDFDGPLAEPEDAFTAA